MDISTYLLAGDIADLNAHLPELEQLGHGPAARRLRVDLERELVRRTVRRISASNIVT